MEEARQHPALTEDEERRRAERRLRGFKLHFAGYFVVMAVVVPVNLLWLGQERPWFVVPMVGWGAALAIHAAWVMGLFRRLFRTPQGED